MSTYKGTVVKDKAAVHSTPSRDGGNKIGNPLKAGVDVVGDKLANGSDGKPWLHITKPMDGWVFTDDISYTASTVDSPPAPNISTPPPNISTTPATPISQPTIDVSTPNTSTSAGNLYKVKIWGDPVMVAQGFDVNFVKTSNFQAVPLFIEDGSCGGVTSFLHIPRADVEKLKGLQISDDPDNTVQQKMHWLCGSYRGKIYMYDEPNDDWEISPFIRWGSIALGGNLVMVDKLVDMVVKPPDNKKRSMTMARLVCFRNTDWGKTWHTHPHLVHRAYCAYHSNHFGDTPHGIVYTPLYSPLDWDFGGTYQPKAWYVPLEWLEKQPA